MVKVLRSLIVTEEVWNKAKQLARKKERLSISRLVDRLLKEYVERNS